MSDAGQTVFRTAGAEPGVPLGKGSRGLFPQGSRLPAPFMLSITPKMASLKKFVRGYLAINEAAPSYEEIADALGLKSKSGVHRMITLLEQRGHIVRTKGHARSLQVVEHHNCPNCGHALVPPPLPRPKRPRRVSGIHVFDVRPAHTEAR